MGSLRKHQQRNRTESFFKMIIEEEKLNNDLTRRKVEKFLSFDPTAKQKEGVVVNNCPYRGRLKNNFQKLNVELDIPKIVNQNSRIFSVSMGHPDSSNTTLYWISTKRTLNNDDRIPKLKADICNQKICRMEEVRNNRNVKLEKKYCPVTVCQILTFLSITLSLFHETPHTGHFRYICILYSSDKVRKKRRITSSRVSGGKDEWSG